MIPDPITIDGKSGTVVYLDAEWHPVPSEQATMAKVLFDDGSVSFFTTGEETQKREYVRDEQGRFAETGKQLQGDEEEEEEKAHTFFHGTSEARLASILKQGLLTARAGETWPAFSQRGTVYMTADEDDALRWAGNAVINAGDNDAAIAILTIRVPKEKLADLVRDTHFVDVQESPARQFKGDIPPSWIIGAKIGRPTDDPWEEFKWKTVKADDGQIIYVAILLQPVAPGIGGLTRKFDEAKHPRGEDGRFIEATQPRIFNRPSEVVQETNWGETSWRWIDKETGKSSGHLLTGEPIPREQIPPKLYHVTTNAPAVESSGVLLGLLESGGLGGGQAQGVSFTSSKEDAVVIQRELRRAVLIARGDVDMSVFKDWAAQDELMAGLPEGALAYALGQAQQAWEGNSFTLEHSYVSGQGYVGPITPDERERLRRSLMKDVLNSYLWARETAAEKAAGKPVPILKNPILFSDQKLLANLEVKNVQILETAAEDIPAEALVTTGSDKFLHEVRVYADVPRRRKKVAKEFEEEKHPRHPSGSAEGGQFAETGRSGEPTPDPVLAVQAKAGIAAVEELLPEAVKTADFSQAGIQDWEDVDDEGQNEAYFKFLESYEEDLDTSSLADDVKEELKKENQKVLDEAVEDVERRLSHETFIDEFGKQRALAIGEGATPPATVEEQFQLKKTLDMETLDYGYGDDDDGTVELDWDKLRFTSGKALTAEEKEIVKQQWDSAYEKAFEDALQEEYESSSYQERESELRDEAAREAWNNLSDSEKLQIYENEIAGGYGRTYRRRVSGREPDQWTTGVESGTHSDEDYARTHAIALKLAELRTEQLREERGLLKGVPFGHLPQDTPRYIISEGTTHTPENPNYIIRDVETDDVIGASNTLEQATINAEEWSRQQASKPPVSTEKLIRDVWEQWKVSSNANLSLSMQLASAIELGGHHRLTPEEVQEAIKFARPYGGIATLQAYVRAQWETTQFVMDKAGEDKISVYRGLMLPGEKVEATTKTYADKLGRPIAPPANLKTGDDPNTKEPYVSFDFNGEHFVVQKERARPKSITDLGPQTWHEVAGGTKEEVYQKWKEDAQGAFAADVAAGKVTPERAEELTKKLFDKLGDDSRFELLKTYASTGRVFLKVPPPRPYESDEEAVSRRLKKYEEDQQVHREDPQILTKLPDLILQRAGAQSTTGTRTVANDWGGVGNLPENPTRVVLRLEVPPTSVLSLPVYGQNSQEEHETVIMGTKDKWLWDAWKNKAPSFSLPISESARKAETTPLVIDLQAEDRGKPHWMSGVDWSTVEKREYAREPAGTERGGEFAQTRNGARAALQEAVGGEIPVGVDDHPTAIKAAHETAVVLREMRAKGYEMPEEVEVRTQAKKYPSGEAEDRGLLVIRVPDHLPDDMSLDEAYNLVYGSAVKVAVIEDWETREIRKYAGDTFRDLVIHEMGHINRRGVPRTPNITVRSSPEERAKAQESSKAFNEELAAIKQFERHARLHVSEYAATNPDEFVAEVFTVLYNGRTLPAETMQIYNALRGAKIR